MRFEAITSACGYLAYAMGLTLALGYILLGRSALPPDFMPASHCTVASLASPACLTPADMTSCALPLALAFRLELEDKPDVTATATALLPLAPHEAIACLADATLSGPCAALLHLAPRADLACAVRLPSPGQDPQVVIRRYAPRMIALLDASSAELSVADAVAAGGTITSRLLYLALLALLCREFAFMKALTCNAPPGLAPGLPRADPWLRRDD
ncbi:uncharacterized protein AMSG_10778 [Thecamonas trahens ATCC 50062]|uniref:Uncharacterized protein n=1 Tax=Thecamonas trahens ATCC 50062 TaxID=461836 RepID=A0A0L0DSI1_THETB|nr:hypothetical protein AMSG_10778 [Thecamonas trahens ATCC 50062]KNC55167.1 hypothetical protein AMSG_10778 [Thecamonas trahens ATCC 50062]|eukprot:XP_013753220.1 hypothetical protein AMSG_10778 [Thecamonas trahens ATCC 50062]